jgi:hypothetical protein
MQGMINQNSQIDKSKYNMSAVLEVTEENDDPKSSRFLNGGYS